MKQHHNNKTKWIHLRLTEAEYEKVNEDYRMTTCQALSEYARKKLFGRPVAIKYRNQSSDELIAQIILLRTGLSAIGHNYNQVVRKLHTLKDITELRAWIMLHENSRQALHKAIEETKMKITELTTTWLL